VASKPTFREKSLFCSSGHRVVCHLPDDRGGSRNVGLLAVKPPDAASSPRMFEFSRQVL
jgi:hypothetical protein